MDPAYATLVPRDPGVTSLGGPVMTEQDVSKLRRAYSCVGRDYGGCGGSLVGVGGSIDGNRAGQDGEGCEWLVTVEDGNLVQIEFQNFKVRRTLVTRTSVTLVYYYVLG